MKIPSPSFLPFPGSCRSFAALFACFVAFAISLSAQNATTATIRGTISNAATGNNLNQASVRLSGLPHETLTERDGSYTIIGVAPGTYEITVSYTGLDAEKRTVIVSPGETSRQDFTLTSGIYKL